MSTRGRDVSLEREELLEAGQRQGTQRGPSRLASATSRRGMVHQPGAGARVQQTLGIRATGVELPTSLMQPLVSTSHPLAKTVFVSISSLNRSSLTHSP